jgi:hypothetical protein
MSGQQSIDSGKGSVASTTRFDQKLISKLHYSVPGLRPTMVDHTLERVPISSVNKKTVCHKPFKQPDWGGGDGGASTLHPLTTMSPSMNIRSIGAFYPPSRCSITKGPTTFDVAVDMSPSVNMVEQHFTNFFQSGEHSRFPDWTRTHWTEDVVRILLCFPWTRYNFNEFLA